VQLALNDAYRPVTSGAFTLTENYAYTVEAFRAYLDRLNEGGLLLVTRWLQTPPSEDSTRRSDRCGSVTVKRTSASGRATRTTSKKRNRFSAMCLTARK